MVIANQHAIMMTIDGRKPLTPVATGNASIPPPMQVPATKNNADITLAARTLLWLSKLSSKNQIQR